MIEAFAPGTTDAWGIGADALCAANPALVHCSITGFGPTGPYANVKSYDPLVAAKVGLFARGGFGHRDGPIHYPVPWGSFGAAMQAVAGILGALTVREQTGRGQQLSATMVAGLDPVDYFVSTIAQLMAKRGEEPLIDARTAIGANRYGVLVATSDGRFIQTSTMLPHQGRALTEVAGLAHLLDDPRFAELPRFATAEDAQEWEDALWEAFRQEDLKHWLPLLEASPDVAFEVAATSEEGMEHPQIVHNGDVVTVDDPSRGPIRQVGPIGHFSESPLVVDRSAPALDANDGPFTLHPPPAGGADAPAHPFAGVTIVEFGCFYAMPYGVTMAAALGARVIKIEDGNGDPHRSSFGAEVASNKTTAGKESISLDLRNPQGQEIARRICAQADVFVTGFRSGVADRLGLGYDELRPLNPRLVYVHAAGYGTDGPYAHRAPLRPGRPGGRRQLRPAGRLLGRSGAERGDERHRAAGDRGPSAQPGRRRRLQRRPRGPRRARPGDLPPAPHRPGPVRADVDDQRQRVVLLRRLLHVRRQAADPAVRQRVLRNRRRSIVSTRPLTAGCASPSARSASSTRC